MISILKKSNECIILAKVTDFSESMGYCEYRILNMLKGIRALPSKEKLIGEKLHRKEEILEEMVSEFRPITMKELKDISKDIEFKRESIYTRFLHSLKINGLKICLLLYGRADKIMRKKGVMIVEETKFTSNEDGYKKLSEPYEDQKLQVLTYVNSSFTSNGSFNPKEWLVLPSKKKCWRIIIKNRKGKTIKIFEGDLNKELENYFHSKLQRFILIILGKEKPTHHNNVRKCFSCSYQECEYRI